MKKKKTISIGKVFFNVPVALILIIIALLVLVPVIWMTFSAFKTEREIISWPPTFIPKTFTLENFVDVQGRINIIRYIANSVIYAGVYKMGMYDTYWGLIIPRVAVAGSIFMMRAAFTGIPKEMAEAARIDGLSEFGIFWKIMLPQVKPAVITLVILSVNGSWNDLLWPMIVTSSTEMRTLANGLALFIGQNTIEYGAAFAGALVSLLPMFVLYMFGQKYFVEGMSSGGLKG